MEYHGYVDHLEVSSFASMDLGNVLGEESQWCFFLQWLWYLC